MKNKFDDNIDVLFQKAKEIPTEIPFEKVEKLILNFPKHPVPVTETHWFVKLFNLKYIAMTLIPFITVLTFWLVPLQPESTAPITQIDVKETSIVPATLPEDPIIKTPKEVAIRQVEKHPNTLSNSTTETIENQERPKVDYVTPKVEILKTETTEKIVDSRENPKTKFDYSSTYIKPDIISEGPSPLPDISTPQLKKLRRVLYKNLINDGVITNKFILVEMQLLTEEILINSQPLPQKFLLKYRDLTGLVGVGPVRKIKMHPDFILAGDFTEAGFKGHGFGRFTEKLLETNNELFQPESLTEKLKNKEDFLEMENKALRLFASKIQQKTPNSSGRKRLFSPRLNGNKSEDLHTDLTLLLTEDKFINDEDEFAVIQLPKNIIRINGQELSGELLKKYQKLINEYGIKHGRERMILLSPHFLKVGNFSYGNFTGTAHTLPFQD